MDPQDFLRDRPQRSAQEQLAAMVSVLVGPQGCPWDQKQTAADIIDYVIDEAHELKQAMLDADPELVVEELGDLLFTVEFLKERLKSQATVDQAAAALVEKMVRRHPHVFEAATFRDESALKLHWETAKRKEKTARERFDQDIPASLPATKRALKVLSRAGNAGFRYLSGQDAMDKVWEELWELDGALEQDHFSDELGDLLLSLLTLARFRGVSADTALNGAVKKLCDRLQRLEERAGKPLQEIPHSDLARLYQESKAELAPTTAFFNYSGVSPWPRPVRTAVRKACQNVGSRGIPAALEMIQERESLKPLLRSFCGATDDHAVCLVPNVSTAALGVAYAQEWKPGDKVVLGGGEFPANTVPWMTAARTFEVDVLWFEEDLFRTDEAAAWCTLETLLAEQKPRLLALSAVAFWSGFRLELERLSSLCVQYGVRLYIDAIQALGNTPLRCPPTLDYLAGGSHKAMLSPEGAGFLLVSPAAAADWQPRLASWLSLPDPVHFLSCGVWQSLVNDAEPRPADPTTLGGGSLNSLGYAGLQAALEFLSEKDLEAEFERILGLQDTLEEGLVDLGWTSLRAARKENRSAILSFRGPSGTDLVALQSRMAAQGISVGIPNGVLRFGFHIFNTDRDVERVLTYLRP